MWIWFWHAWGAWFLIEFFRHWVKFRRLEADVAAGAPLAVYRYNRALRGLPGSGYAKMLGKVPLPERDGLEGRSGSGPTQDEEE